MLNYILQKNLRFSHPLHRGRWFAPASSMTASTVISFSVHKPLTPSWRTKRNLCNQPAPYWYPGWERSTYPLSKGRVKDEFPFGIPRWDIMIPKRIWTTQETSQNLHLQTYQNQKAFFWISTAQLGCLNSLFMNFCGSLLTNFVRSAIYQCFYISFLHPYTNMIKHVDLILGLAQVPKHISFKSNFEKQKRPPKKGMFWEIVV